MDKTEYNYLLGFYLHLATFEPMTSTRTTGAGLIGVMNLETRDEPSR
jgi:hypothetical protein